MLHGESEMLNTNPLPAPRQRRTFSTLGRGDGGGFWNLFWISYFEFRIFYFLFVWFWLCQFRNFNIFVETHCMRLYININICSIK
uniref:Uncharacterized protein n=1 Tax=Kuenenia stuttgartiensis TaxID=174633 RepID=Q1PW85_KUEST|nr:unknown protein [Candidatus Kuenenia stuttgartiensis]